MNTEQDNLTANQCRELAEALLEEAAALPEASCSWRKAITTLQN